MAFDITLLINLYGNTIEEHDLEAQNLPKPSWNRSYKQFHLPKLIFLGGNHVRVQVMRGWKADTRKPFKILDNDFPWILILFGLSLKRRVFCTLPSLSHSLGFRLRNEKNLDNIITLFQATSLSPFSDFHRPDCINDVYRSHGNEVGFFFLPKKVDYVIVDFDRDGRRWT